MDAEEGPSSTLIYGLRDRMPHGRAALVGLQHAMAMFIGIVTPPLIIARTLELSDEVTAHLVSMALLASGLSTLVQVRTIGPVGSGLLSVQGTSFSFLAPLLQAGQAGGLPLMIGMSLALAPVEMVLSRFLARLRRVFTPVVSGVVVLLIGLSLAPVGMRSIAGGLGADAPRGAGIGVAALVIATAVGLQAARRPWARISAVAVALLLGYAVCAVTGRLAPPPSLSTPWLALPAPLKYGLAFSWELALPFGLIYLLTTLETMGDLTATLQLSREPIEGPVYWQRLRAGVLADGLNSALAAVCNSFPNTTFSQNNGLIQLTGVASRQAGYWVAGLLCAFGLFPMVGGWIAVMPAPVLGGVTLLLFGLVAAAGVRILQQTPLAHREMLIIALSLAVGIGVQAVPEVLLPLPPAARMALQSAITAGGLTALVLNALLPRDSTGDRTEEGG
jgi:NCS2 family nucleobase:cation symporter-2/xanthine permease XanP